MFDRTDIEEYQSVTAPDGLRERVMNTYDKGKVTNISLYRSIIAVAACLVLVISASTFAGSRVGNISIIMNGKQIPAAPTQIADNNGIAMVAAFMDTPSVQTTVPIEIKALLKTVITVSDGEINVFDAGTGELLYTGNEYEAKGRVLIDWSVDTADAASFVMTLKNALKVETLNLQYDGNNSWTICNK